MKQMMDYFCAQWHLTFLEVNNLRQTKKAQSVKWSQVLLKKSATMTIPTSNGFLCKVKSFENVLIKLNKGPVTLSQNQRSYYSISSPVVLTIKWHVSIKN